VGDTRGGNWGCHHSIFPGKLGDLFCSSLSLSLSLFIAFTRVHPLQGVTPRLFLPARPRFFVSPLFFVNLPTNFFLRVSPPGGCHPGRSVPPFGPPSDATEKSVVLAQSLRSWQIYKAKWRQHCQTTTTANTAKRQIETATEEYTSCPKKRPPFYFSNNTVKNQPILMVFGVWNPEKIWHR